MIIEVVNCKKVIGKIIKKKKLGLVKGSNFCFFFLVRCCFLQWEMELEFEDDGDFQDGFYFFDIGFLFLVQIGCDNEIVGNSGKEDGNGFEEFEIEEFRVILRVFLRKRVGFMIVLELIFKCIKKVVFIVNIIIERQEFNIVLVMVLMMLLEISFQRVICCGCVVRFFKKVIEVVN